MANGILFDASNNPETTGDITLKDIEDWMEALRNAPPKEPPKIMIPAGDYPDMSDESFLEMCSYADVTFVGGSDQVGKLLARCKKLGLNVADPVEAKWPIL